MQKLCSVYTCMYYIHVEKLKLNKSFSAHTGENSFFRFHISAVFGGVFADLFVVIVEQRVFVTPRTQCFD